MRKIIPELFVKVLEVFIHALVYKFHVELWLLN